MGWYEWEVLEQNVGSATWRKASTEEFDDFVIMHLCASGWLNSRVSPLLVPFPAGTFDDILVNNMDDNGNNNNNK